MRKILLLSASLFIITYAFAQQQARRLDQPMQTKSCKIKIEANAFIAKTFIELEYYNPQEQEIEGLRYFNLQPGQVITGFQLELNGQYREGSIEERWKAANAYNSIVGKRIDPALLQMHYNNNYRLNIYPFAPKSSRKVSITIMEILKQNEKGLLYELPLNFMDSVSSIKIDINVHGKSLSPKAVSGLLHNNSFIKKNEINSLYYEARNIPAKNEVAFIIPVKNNQYHYMVESQNDSNYFSLRLQHDVPQYQYSSASDRLAVFWDISASADLRNIDKEIHFLHSYIASNKINGIDLYSFNNELKHIGSFDLLKQSFAAIRNRINNFNYQGSTNLSVIDLSKLRIRTALVFSDAVQTRGKKDISTGSCQVNFITSSQNADYAYMKKIIEPNGGNIINLHSFKLDSALRRSSQLENMLYEIYADSKLINLQTALPIRGKQLLLTGTAAGTLQLKFGNQLRTASIYNLTPNENTVDQLNTFQTIQMINQYEALQKRSTWQELLIFGLENKIVTAHTAFIVLERIEDYINYKIAPPKELEEQCKMLNYVYKTEYRRKEIEKNSTETMLNDQLAILNSKQQWWSAASANNYLFTTKEKDKNKSRISEMNVDPVKNTSSTTNQFPTGDNTISEVVVTSAFNTKRSARSVSSNVQIVNSEELNTIRGTNLNEALAGKVAGIQVRSQSSAKLGSLSEIRLRGESSLQGSKVIYVVNGTIVPDASYINIDDIEDVTVLQGPNAAALFGPDGANGALVMNLKKGKRLYYGNSGWANYKLRNRQYLEYIDEIKKAGKDMFMQKYVQIKKYYPYHSAFYFDVAQLFFEYGLKEDAGQIMEEGIEATKGVRAGILAAAYIFESQGDYKKAIELYQQIIYRDASCIEAIRDLALCYFRDKQYQLALTTYNNGLIIALSKEGYHNIISQMLNEINALIAVHGSMLDLSNINKDIIRKFPADLYISAENNVDGYSSLSMKAPDRSNFATMVVTNHNKNMHVNNNSEIFIYKSEKGKYKIFENAFDSYYYSIPRYHRIITFKNYQQPDQQIEVQTVNMNGQHGKVEIGSLIW